MLPGRRTQCYAKGHRECGEGCLAPDRLQWVRNGLTLTTADDYNSKVLSERGGAGQRVGYTKIGPRASPNRITQNHLCYCFCKYISEIDHTDAPGTLRSFQKRVRGPAV